MAKRILYKVEKYHCPKCGAGTDPRKKFCEWCGRDLNIRQENKNKDKFRLLVNCGEYVFFDDIYRLQQNTSVPEIECTCLEDTQRHSVFGTPVMSFEIEMFCTDRARELMELPYQGIKDIRFEHLGFDKAYEMQSFVSSVEIQNRNLYKVSTVNIRFEQYKPAKIYDHAIPDEILDIMRCPNCGAPIMSRFGACSYCSGWSEVEW